MSSTLVLTDQQQVDLDEQGFLLDWQLWQPEVAELMAEADGLSLGEAHWEVLAFLRDYFERYDLAPGMRVMVKAVRQRLGEEKGNSRYLYRLFPEGPAKQGCRYAGLPKPVSCI